MIQSYGIVNRNERCQVVEVTSVGNPLNQRIFAKICASRIAPVIERLTHPYQYAFPKGRYIHDGVLALHEIIREVKTRHHKGVFLKLDFQMAYDRLDWHFLRQVLQRRGFDDRLITWVIQFIMSGSTSININGEVGQYFRPSCGVRQGDPIPPYSLTPRWMPLRRS
jgi:hypothetical protein